MNYSVDDTYPELVYSSNWSVQSPNDPDIQQFFDSTYHVADADGAYFNTSFIGSAISIFGSKGPQHAGYSVLYDGVLWEGLSAYSEQLEFQQPLFQHVFDNGSATHFVTLTAHFDGANQWLDCDYLTFTTPSTISTSTLSESQTRVPPWLDFSSSPGFTGPTLGQAGSTSSPSPSAASSSSSMPVANILSILFGSIIGLALLITLTWCLLHWRKARSQTREGLNYQYGAASVSSPSASQTRFVDATSIWSSPSAPSTADPHQFHPPRTESLSGHVVHDSLTSFRHPRHDDSDSLRTNFLQV